MTLADAIQIALAAYDEDAAEREAMLAALAAFVFVDKKVIVDNLTRAWSEGWEDEIRAAITQYQTERTGIDAEIAAAEASGG